MTVLQLAAINLILISLIVCQTLSYDVDSFFFIIMLPEEFRGSI